MIEEIQRVFESFSMSNLVLNLTLMIFGIVLLFITFFVLGKFLFNRKYNKYNKLMHKLQRGLLSDDELKSLTRLKGVNPESEYDIKRILILQKKYKTLDIKDKPKNLFGYERFDELGYVKEVVNKKFKS